jgi:hypothetical protein
VRDLPHLLGRERPAVAAVWHPTSGPIAIGWCVALSILGSWWALRLYDRDPAH